MKLKPLKVYEKFIVVTGSGEFPIDMLRYDAAFPSSEKDSALIGDYEKRRIALVIRGVSTQSPTEDRWKSFGWMVTAVFYERHEAENYRDRVVAA